MTNLQRDGFLFFSYSPDPSLKKHFLDINNYREYKKEVIPMDGDGNVVTIEKFIKPVEDPYHSLFHSYTPEGYKPSRDGYEAHMFLKGDILGPHTVPPFLNNDIVRAGIIFWFTPTHFEGREFIFGKVHGPDQILGTDEVCPITKYSWKDKRLEEILRIKPYTGLGMLLDASDPKWYHAVSELISDTPVASIVGNILY